ncbi:hypothetical protein [Propionispira raffinosivorans]|uniref:hypothetical protein n=1 Tax=Propionispira raffinosivorans TaxID=86959 RepID=UPI00036BE4EA|nr:hypothetical protein [Propionispira raffinosivorans]
MKKHMITLLGALFALFLMLPAGFAQAKTPEINDYQWAFSSDQTNYYFGNKKMSYALDEHGDIDKSRLLFSTIMTYEPPKPQAIITQREARGQKLSGYANFHGIIEVREIDLDKKTVWIRSHNDVDTVFNILSSENSDQLYDLKVLPKDQPEYIFAQQVIDYAAKHKDDLKDNTKSMQKELKAAQKAAAKNKDSNKDNTTQK